MTSKKFLNRLAVLTFFLILITGCTPNAEKAPVADETSKEAVDTGILFVDSYPSSAQVYLDGDLKGDSPSTLYNIPAGPHNLTVKKEGYIDFEKRVVITVGRKEEIEARLNLLTPVKISENVSSLSLPPSPLKLNIINISQSYIMYFDFDKELFTDVTTATPDIFSTRYDTYVYFTAISPITMRLLNKQIKDVKKEDCIIGYDTIADLHSGETLCVKTREGIIAAIGGNWKNSPEELEWILFS